MENAEDHLSDIETQLRALAAADAAPRAEDAALLARLMAKADAAAAAATPTPWYRRATLWRTIAACVPLALVAGLSAIAALHYLDPQDAGRAHVKQQLPELATAPAQGLPRTQEDMRLPQGALVTVEENTSQQLATMELALRTTPIPENEVQDLAINTEDPAAVPATLLPDAVLPCAEEAETATEAEIAGITPAEDADEEATPAQGSPTRQTVATYGSGCEAPTNSHPLTVAGCPENTLERGATPRNSRLRQAPQKRAAKKAAPARPNIGARMRELIHRLLQDISTQLPR